MQTQATLLQPVAKIAPPQEAAAQCLHCGSLLEGTPHHEDCFTGFQVALVRQFPTLTDVATLDEVEAIERIFRFWTGMIHALRHRFPWSANRCVERRWEETTGYVERLIARHARRAAAHDTPTAAAS